jgi:MerR family transcriptional regulator/heat shock protein HspR
MTRPIIPRDVVARELSISPGLLLRYESRGLVRVVRSGAEEGYEPAEVRRLWTIVSFQRDLGVNLAGIEVILDLFGRLEDVHRRVGGLAEKIREAIETDKPSADTETDG